MTENKSTIQTAAGVPERERAVLVAVVRDSQELRQSEEYLDELEFLAETADITTVRRFSQRLPQPSSRIYVGPGKLEEIAAYCEEHAVDVAIFDDELTPAQTRNIERAMPCRILDRTRLILDISSRVRRRPMPKRRCSWPNTNTCCPGSPACGRTSNGSAEARVRAAAPANARSKPTAVSYATASRN